MPSKSQIVRDLLSDFVAKRPDDPKAKALLADFAVADVLMPVEMRG